MLARTLLSVCLTALCLAPFAAAQDLDPRLPAIAPYIGKDTAGMTHIDLRKIEIKTAVDRWKKLAPPGSDAILAQVNLFVPVVAGMRDQLVGAGATDIYALIYAEPTKPGIIVLPVEEGKDPQAVVEILKGIPGADKQEIFVHKSAVIAGMGASIKDDVDAIVPARAAEFSYCFKLAGATDFQYIMLPTLEMFEKAIAAAPAGAAAGPAADAIKEHVEKIRAIIFTANLPPKSALALYVKMKDETVATDALAEIQKGLASDDAKVATDHPVFGKLVTAVTPKQDKELLKVVLTDSNGGIQALADSVKEGLSLLGPLLQAGAGGGFPPPQ